MFGHQDDTTQPQPDGNAIPDHAIDAALSEDRHGDPGWGQPSTPAANTVTPTGEAAAVPPASNDQPADTNDLLDIKQKALSQLAPLVKHLDQTPEEKFRTLMMMIQASDDHNKLNEAYATAQQITDEKAKAQALLDVVNEINYFTQSHEA